MIETWVLETTDSYWYWSGRNNKTYREVSYFLEKHTLKRKETIRSKSCVSGGEHNLPIWADRCEHRKSLDIT